MIPKTRTFYDGTANLEFFGSIGTGGITAAEFNQALGLIRNCRSLTLLIDSDGGEIIEAVEMVQAIRRLPMERNAVVVGRCYSAAVDLLLACAWRSAVAGATLMLHRCDALDRGFADQDAAGRTSAYSPRVERGDLRGATREMVKAWINTGTWFNTREMHTFGFVDRIIQPTASVPLVTAIDLAGRNRPRASPPFVEFGTIPETPMFDTHFKRISDEIRQGKDRDSKRRPIPLPEIPARLAGKAFFSNADVEAARVRAAAVTAHDPNDPFAAAKEAVARVNAANAAAFFSYSQREWVARVKHEGQLRIARAAIQAGIALQPGANHG